MVMILVHISFNNFHMVHHKVRGGDSQQFNLRYLKLFSVVLINLGELLRTDFKRE